MSDGKILKPEGWEPPNIKSILERSASGTPRCQRCGKAMPPDADWQRCSAKQFGDDEGVMCEFRAPTCKPTPPSTPPCYCGEPAVASYVNHAMGARIDYCHAHDPVDAARRDERERCEEVWNEWRKALPTGSFTHPDGLAFLRALRATEGEAKMSTPATPTCDVFSAGEAADIERYHKSLWRCATSGHWHEAKSNLDMLLDAAVRAERERYEGVLYERDEARKAAAAAGAIGPWMWEDGADNFVESLGDTQAVRITGGQLRLLIDAARRAGERDGRVAEQRRTAVVLFGRQRADRLLRTAEEKT